jgi:hypothetical protein
MTDRVDEYGERDDKEDGVTHSKKAVADAPRKFD